MSLEIGGGAAHTALTTGLSLFPVDVHFDVHLTQRNGRLMHSSSARTEEEIHVYFFLLSSKLSFR